MVAQKTFKNLKTTRNHLFLSFFIFFSSATSSSCASTWYNYNKDTHTCAKRGITRKCMTARCNNGTLFEKTALDIHLNRSIVNQRQNYVQNIPINIHFMPKTDFQFFFLYLQNRAKFVISLMNYIF